jgi:hypothetical protein
MDDMRENRVIGMTDRRRRVSRAVAARKRLERESAERDRRQAPRTGGRLWLNGIELGGTDPRHAGLAALGD